MKYDERDSIFSRLGLKDGSKEFQEYYTKNPDKKDNDMKLKRLITEKKDKNMKTSQDKLKKMSDSNKSQFLQVDPNESDHEYAANKLMKEYQRVASMVNEKSIHMSINPEKRSISPETMSLLVKEFVRLSGLDIVGITKVDSDDFYSNRGFSKKTHKYGEDINLNYKYAIIFTAPLEIDYINRSPSKELFMAAMLGYAKSSEVAARLAMYIKDLGYDALTDSHFTYHTPISFLGEKAGLGQMGRCNSVVNPKYGNRTKFGAVLTNLPLIEDEKIDFGLKEFCEVCGRCKDSCSMKAISSEASISESGEKYWKNDSEACMKMWINTGFSCGICMSACPFSQGVDEKLISKMKGNHEVMKKILKKHDEKYGKRNHIKNPLGFMPKKK